MQENTFDVIIIGAGAAGLMCAQFAAGSGNKVLILDHSHKLAEKSVFPEVDAVTPI